MYKNKHILVMILLKLKASIWGGMFVVVKGNTLSLITQETGTWLSNAQTGAVITTSTPIFNYYLDIMIKNI
ncbi:MAG: Hypothetical protein AJITA_00707 [Acetilactobacillus jinshanensis]